MNITYYLQHIKDKSIIPIGQTYTKKSNIDGIFYATDGFRLIQNLITNNQQTILELFIIRSDMDKKIYSIEDFLEKIEKYKIILDK